MKTHSCGSILYTIYNNKVCIILGKEHDDWFPFKGKCEKNETYEQAAVREIEEETCRLIKLNPKDISLNCNFSTSRKYYHIGLNFVPYTFVKEFYLHRQSIEDEKCLEKTHIKLFYLYKLDTYNFHQVTMIPLLYYYPFLKNLQEKINKSMVIFSKSGHITSLPLQPLKLDNIKLNNIKADILKYIQVSEY